MELNAGDKVKIRSYEDLAAQFGTRHNGGEIKTSPTMAGSMFHFCGYVVTIEKVTLTGSYKIKEDQGCYFWPKEAFEPCNNNVVIKNRNTSLTMYLHRKKGIPLEFVEDDSDKIHVGNYVEIVNSGQTYDYYRDWVKIHCPEFEDIFKEGEVPSLGAIGRVVGIGKHANKSNVLYGVYIEENDRFSPNVKNGIFCIDESGIKKMKPYK